LKRALALWKQELGPTHPDTAIILSNLATLYGEQGRYTEAEPLHKRALAIREQTLGPTHPVTANSLSNLATLYFEQGRYTEAEPLLKRALAIYEQTFGPEHPDRLKIMGNYVILLRKTNRKGRAAEMEAHLNILRRSAGRPMRQYKGTFNRL
jgi:tetratricopeptide (TPR) repeat protein